MYYAIIVLDEKRKKSYYSHYVKANGNIECSELPPYQDIDKARACYWNTKTSEWVFDEEKYEEILDKKAQAEAESAAREAEAAATPTIAELLYAIMELAESISDIEAALVELAASM